jgi:hypothetical protein
MFMILMFMIIMFRSMGEEAAKRDEVGLALGYLRRALLTLAKVQAAALSNGDADWAEVCAQVVMPPLQEKGYATINNGFLGFRVLGFGFLSFGFWVQGLG